jgi:hypothetical protein
MNMISAFFLFLMAVVLFAMFYFFLELINRVPVGMRDFVTYIRQNLNLLAFAFTVLIGVYLFHGYAASKGRGQVKG